jgi:hypothetical protein
MHGTVSTASGLMANYADVRARLWGTAPRPAVPARERLGTVRYSKPIGPSLMVRQVTLMDVLNAIALETGVTVEQIRSEGRSEDLVALRHAGFLIARRLTKKSTPQIARAFGRSDHTTVLHGLRRAEQRERASPAFAEMIARLSEDLTQPCGFVLPVEYAFPADAGRARIKLQYAKAVGEDHIAPIAGFVTRAIVHYKKTTGEIAASLMVTEADAYNARARTDNMRGRKS